MQEQAAPLEEFLRNAIESRPYTSVAVALGIGWFIGRIAPGAANDMGAPGACPNKLQPPMR
ncbi:MAG: hypothetical protein WA683_16810, partial [Pseudolabrys sp.]